MIDLFNDNGAEFSKCRNYRYALWRIWDKNKPFIMFIGLNPSKANEEKTDNTIAMVKGFAFNWGYGGVYMLNCFPYVSTNPDNLRNNGNTVKNDYWLSKIACKCDKVIFAWGAFKIVKELGRDIELIKMFPNAEALIINKDGSPHHPLYVKTDTKPIKFQLTNNN